MFESLLKNSDFSALFKLVSPNFFKVVPVPQLLGVAGKILANSRSFSPEQPELARSIGLLTRAGFPVQTSPTGELTPIDITSRFSVLELYFLQIALCDTWLLDFRGTSFRSTAENPLVWQPGPYFLTLTPVFRDAVRALYEGFYLDRPEQFEGALRNLGVLSAKQVFLDHFGMDDQTQVRFNLAEFEQTFAKVFQACAKSGEKISPEFTALGVLLLTLYENLQVTDQAYNVREAFLNAHRKAQTIREGGQA
jgi:hypothetical protein